MKRNALIFLLTLVSLFTANDLLAQQDKIYLINGTQVEGSIIETSDEQVKIKIKRDDGNELIRTFNTEEINKIVFRDGTVEVIKHELEVTPAMDLSAMKKRGVKINFFGPLYGHTDITYEQYLSPGRLYEVTLGIIGLGKNQDLNYGFSGESQKRDAAGAFVSGGYKFQTKPTYRVKNMRYTHLMQGWFIKPTLSLGFYSQNRIVGDSFTGNNTVEKENVTFGAVEIKFGKQWVFSNSLYLGLDLGLGYVMDNVKNDDNNFLLDDITRSHYALRKFGNDGTSFGSSFAVQLGFLF